MDTDNRLASDQIDTRKDYEKTPQGNYAYYLDELSGAQKTLKNWQKTADAIVSRYKGERRVIDADSAHILPPSTLNIFHSDVQTIASMLYGQLPTVDVSRRYADANDDIGRVAAEVLERMLNLDVLDNGESYDAVLRSALFDRLVSGLGVARVRYKANIVKELAPNPVDPEGPPIEVDRLESERAPIDYYFWGDVLWSWGRNFSELRWVAFRNYLTRDEVEKRFPDAKAAELTYKKQKVAGHDESEVDSDQEDIWNKAEIWEIWDKKTRRVSWLSPGYETLLDDVADPLGLSGFFPCPPFLMANPTTTLYIPTPDYKIAQDLYAQADLLQERITIITEAVKVVGVYDGSADGIKRMLTEGFENDLIPVDNWALFAEKGGIKGVIDWLPLAETVGALDKLREMRTETIGLLQQITGMSDIMRGDLGSPYEGVGQSQMKAQFGSARIQALQDQFANFAGGLMQIKAEIVARHFSPETILKNSNMQHSPDAELLQEAIALIKQPEEARLRVAVKPESIALANYSQMKQERSDFLNALATFLQSSAPLMEQDSGSTPFILQLLQWGLAGFKGSQEIEGVIDRAIEESFNRNEQEQGEDPAAQELAAQQQMEQMKLQVELQKIQAKAQADAMVRQQDQQSDIETAQALHEMKMAEIEAESAAKLAEMQAKLVSEAQQEQIQTQANVDQIRAQAGTEIEKDSINTEMEIKKDVTATQLKMAEIHAATKAKIAEAENKERTAKNKEGSDE